MLALCCFLYGFLVHFFKVPGFDTQTLWGWETKEHVAVGLSSRIRQVRKLSTAGRGFLGFAEDLQSGSHLLGVARHC